MLGADADPESDLDELSEALEREGIDIPLDGETPSQRRHRLEQELDGPENVDLAPEEAPDKTNDPVRLYLREMGTVPLLTREGEIEIAKRFERGHFRALKAISRSPIAIQELIALGSDLERGIRSIKEVVVFDEEDVTDEIVALRLKATLGLIGEMAACHKRACDLEEKIKGISRKKNARLHRRYRWKIRAQSGCRLPHPATTQIYPAATQAPDREGDRNGRQDAISRPAGPEPWPEN